jgi:hypothetical protein
MKPQADFWAARSCRIGSGFFFPQKQRKRNNGPGEFPEPSPVSCWDWTKAIALPRFH